MTKKRLLELAKWLWIALVFIAAGYYLVSRWQKVAGYFQTIPLINLLLGAVALAGAKVILVALSKFALDSEADGDILPFRQVYQIVAITQLGKYIPGGVWHFVGRINAYVNHSASIKKSTWVLVKETYWLLSGALLFGALAGIYAGPNGGLINRAGIQLSPAWLAVTTILLLCAWPLSIVLFDRVINRHRKPLSAAKILQLVTIQVAAWALLGFSFVLTNPVVQPGTILLQMSVYSFSWALGYVVIFAPGGIGIREGAITFFLAGTMGADNILIYSTAHRFLYVIIEVLLGVVAGLLRDKKSANP
jgi:hypothetical protein